MLSEVNKVIKDILIFSLLFYILFQSPIYFNPPLFSNFSKSLKPRVPFI